jgi:transcriptional regulator with XRE-family HTH domain
MALEDLSTNMKAARKAHGYTQERLARRADLSLNVVAKIELGLIQNPHFATVSAIAGALDITVDELVGGVVPKGPSRHSSGPEIELEDLHAHDIPSVHEDVEILNKCLEGVSQATREGIVELLREWRT